MLGMIRQAQKIRIYPTDEQKRQLAGAMGCYRWWWNYALNKSIATKVLKPTRRQVKVCLVML